MSRDEELRSTRESWDRATRAHNSHKGDQAQQLRDGLELLFPEELELLGPLGGKRLVHLQCNAGQDSLCLARRGALVHGVDFSPVAVACAEQLAQGSGIAATFEEAEILEWTARTERRFELAFASYGVTGWHPDVDAWMRGAARVLEPGGALVYVEFHPLIWSFGKGLDLTGDDYFAKTPFVEPVNDYVAESGPGLGSQTGEPIANDVPAYGFQHGLGEVITAVARSGLQLEVVREYPFSNGFRPSTALVLEEGRRWTWPPGKARVPMMYGLRAHKPR